VNLRLRPLAEADLPRLQALIAADPGFSERTNGRPPSADAAELLSAAPPGVAAHRRPSSELSTPTTTWWRSLT